MATAHCTWGSGLQMRSDLIPSSQFPETQVVPSAFSLGFAHTQSSQSSGVPGMPSLGPALMVPGRPQLSERYGPVFTVHLGTQKTVVLAGYQAVREALLGTGHRLADRPPIAIFQRIQGGAGECVELQGGTPVGLVVTAAPLRHTPQASSSRRGPAGGLLGSSLCPPCSAWASGGGPGLRRSCAN